MRHKSPEDVVEHAVSTSEEWAIRQSLPQVRNQYQNDPVEMERLYHQVSLRRAPQIRQLRVINYTASAGPNSNSKKYDRTRNEAKTATGCVNANYDQRRLNHDTADIRRPTRADRSQFLLRPPFIKSTIGVVKYHFCHTIAWLNIQLWRTHVPTKGTHEHQTWHTGAQSSQLPERHGCNSKRHVYTLAKWRAEH